MAPVSNQPYFVPHRPGTSITVRDAGDEGTTVEEIPASVDPDDFAPKLLNFLPEDDPHDLQGTATDETTEESYVKSTIDRIFGSKTQREVKFSALDESAKKARPKLYFAGERTFLQWMHTGILLAGISMALGSQSETGSVADWVSVFLLPVAVCIVIYAMRQYSKRTYMIAMRSPGPYEDRWGPVVIGGIFTFSLFAQLFVILLGQSNS